MKTPPFEQEARTFCDGIRILAAKPENLDTLQGYLELHFDRWMKIFAQTPQGLAGEMQYFATIEEVEP